MDVDLTFYPWVARYDNLDATFYSQSSVNYLSGQASATSIKGGLLSGETSTVGFTPFQVKTITESVRLGKPKKVRLGGGQMYVMVIRDNKPLNLNYARLFGNGSPNTVSFSGHTRGCFMTARSTVVNDSASINDIDFADGALDIQNVTSYEWAAAPTPFFYYDVIPNGNTVAAYDIIQPQTGVVNTSPLKV